MINLNTALRDTCLPVPFALYTKKIPMFVVGAHVHLTGRLLGQCWDKKASVGFGSTFLSLFINSEEKHEHSPLS